MASISDITNGPSPATVTFDNRLFALSAIWHFRDDAPGPEKTQYESTRKHLKLMDLIALILVTEPTHDCAAVSFWLTDKIINVTYAKNRPSNPTEKMFIRQLVKLLQSCIPSLTPQASDPDSPVTDILSLIYKNCHRKIHARFIKMIHYLESLGTNGLDDIVGLPTENTTELLAAYLFPTTKLASDEQLSKKPLPPSASVIRKAVINWLVRCKTSQINLDKSFIIFLSTASAIGYTKGMGEVLHDRELLRHIQKLGDYFVVAIKLVTTLKGRKAGSKIRINEIKPPEPKKVTSIAIDALAILNKWAQEKNYDEVTLMCLKDAFPRATEESLVRGYPSMTEINYEDEGGDGNTKITKLIKLNTCCHAECTVVMHRLSQLAPSILPTSPNTTIEVGISKPVCWTCDTFFSSLEKHYPVTIAFSTRHGKITAGWRPPQSTLPDAVITAEVEAAVDHELGAIIDNAHRRRMHDSNPLLSSDEQQPPDITSIFEKRAGVDEGGLIW